MGARLTASGGRDCLVPESWHFRPQQRGAARNTAHFSHRPSEVDEKDHPGHCRAQARCSVLFSTALAPPPATLLLLLLRWLLRGSPAPQPPSLALPPLLDPYTCRASEPNPRASLSPQPHPPWEAPWSHQFRYQPCPGDTLDLALQILSIQPVFVISSGLSGKHLRLHEPTYSLAHGLLLQSDAFLLRPSSSRPPLDQAKVKDRPGSTVPPTLGHRCPRQQLTDRPVALCPKCITRRGSAPGQGLPAPAGQPS